MGTGWASQQSWLFPQAFPAPGMDKFSKVNIHLQPAPRIEVNAGQPFLQAQPKPGSEDAPWLLPGNPSASTAAGKQQDPVSPPPQQHTGRPAFIYSETNSRVCSELHGMQSVPTETARQLFSSRNSAQIKHGTNTWTPAQQHSCSSFSSCLPPNLEDHFINVVGCYQMERRGMPRTDHWLLVKLGGTR